MIEKKKEDKEEERYRYSGIGYVRRIQKAKKDYIRHYEYLTGKPQEGLKIHIDFHYFLNTDFDWIVKLVRESIIEVIQEHRLKIPETDLRYRKRIFFTFNIEQINTEKCIDILFIPGVIDPEIYEILRDIGQGIAIYLIIEGIKKLKNKKGKIRKEFKDRPNLKHFSSKKVKYKRYPDGTIEYIEEKDEFEFK